MTNHEWDLEKLTVRLLVRAVFEICVTAKAEFVGSFFGEARIPRAEAGGLFKPSLPKGEKSSKSLQRKLVDFSNPTYSPQ
ncbi:MAG TPA: hypothetical protein VKD91_09335 [Pyrinomonadaceae bacterium]|nr:hypothetical protein [Pyrinomonadaceae bacterium]